ncbi:MAG: WecB/TagA/CpsF family glycosyltransferase [Ignavibacteria bacterium]|nr:WecB/TagA/CpsF family glycosyltransferase [Ignavibacteria bacterium]
MRISSEVKPHAVKYLNTTALNISSSKILGIRVHHVTLDETLSIIGTMVFSGNRHLVVPLNPELVMTAQNNSAFRDVVNNASLVLPDGVGIVLASWLMGDPLRERVTGIDTVRHLAVLAQRQGLRLFLLGAAPGVAERAALRLQELHPGLQIAGTYAGSPHPDEEREICRRIEEADPQILLVAYGAPRQEIWVARNLSKLKVPVAICVGGTFDFIAGVSPRAPRWLQVFGLEWPYRLIREPRRWRRMLALPLFAAAVVRYRFTTTY